MKELIDKYEEYIKLLGKELDDLAILAFSRGWKSTRFEEGNKLRKELQILKEEYEKNTS